jgi:type II secretory pathway component PulJ
MGEVIRLEEIDRERRRSRTRVAERAHLERAVALLRENLAGAAEALRDAPQAPEQIELLGRIERFTALIRYGLRMLGEAPGGDGLDGPSIVARP